MEGSLQYMENTANRLEVQNEELRAIIREYKDKVAKLDTQVSIIIEVLNLMMQIFNTIDGQLRNVNQRICRQRPCREDIYSPE